MLINYRELILFFGIILSVEINGERLSQEENLELQKTCGRKLNYQSRATSEEPNQYGDFPWAVSVYVRFMNRTLFSFDVVHVPGTIVSPRHILTYSTIQVGSDGNLLLLGTNRTNYHSTCEGDHLIIPQAMNSRYDFGFEYFKEYNNHREFETNIAKITVINGCEASSSANVMVFELISELDLGTRTAACISNSPKNWLIPNEFSVYGMNRLGMLVSGKFAPTNCTVREPYACAVAVDKNEGLCQGGFGENVVAKIDGQFTMLGLDASGNIRCGNGTNTRSEFKFVNIGYLRKEICDVTGICVAAPLEEKELEGTADETEVISEGPEETTEEPKETTTEDDEAFTRGTEEESTTEDYEVFTRGSEEETTTEDDEAFPRGPEEEKTTEEPEEITTEDDAVSTRGPKEPDETTTEEPTIISVTALPMPLETTTTPSPQRIGEDGEVIVAETFPKQPLAPTANCTGSNVPEVIIAERIVPMQIGVGVNGPQMITAEQFEPISLTRGDRVRTVNININFH